MLGVGRLGVVEADKVLTAGAEVGPADLKERAGLVWLFFRDLVPGDLGRAVRCGRVGDGSREPRGEGVADDAAEVCDGCEVLWLVDGHESDRGVTVLVVDSRESLGLWSG
jgi:hypothetical protein